MFLLYDWLTFAHNIIARLTTLPVSVPSGRDDEF